MKSHPYIYSSSFSVDISFSRVIRQVPMRLVESRVGKLLERSPHAASSATASSSAASASAADSHDSQQPSSAASADGIATGAAATHCEAMLACGVRARIHLLDDAPIRAQRQQTAAAAAVAAAAAAAAASTSAGSGVGTGGDAASKAERKLAGRLLQAAMRTAASAASSAPAATSTAASSASTAAAAAGVHIAFIGPHVAVAAAAAVADKVHALHVRSSTLSLTLELILILNYPFSFSFSLTLTLFNPPPFMCVRLLALSQVLEAVVALCGGAGAGASGGKADNAQGSVLRPPAATSTSTSAASDSGSALEELARALAETPAAKLAPTRVL